ncbi:MAG: poly(glycerol-phosphate) alpha-glucosyltransferase [Parcubacteria group bacterium Athens0714_16]|nr:MAG: poly(glycerol-phosphate) alpha-glucosyltransferase [Parcubacteria group bacterium Athens0714_16]
MKVLTIGSDRKLFENGSAVLSRVNEYAERMDELHIIVFSLKSLGFSEIHSTKLHIYPTNSSCRLLYIRDAIKKGKDIIRKNKFKKSDSVISTQDPFETGKVGVVLKKIFDLPLQIQIHTDFLSPYFRNSFLNKIRVLISKSVIPKADGLRVVSSVISDSIKQAFLNLKARIDILPVFVDIEKIINREVTYYTQERGIESILMVSRFTKEKRIDIGLKVFKKVLEQKKNISMTIIGFGPEEKNLKQKIDELNIGNKVEILEWENDVVSVYKKAGIFLLTSEYEGYGMTLIEAGASGCPIVTTNVGVAKTDLFKSGENSFVCSVGDVNCLSKSIINLIENPDKRKLFKERMRDTIQGIAVSKEEYMSRYVNILKNLL